MNYKQQTDIDLSIKLNDSIKSKLPFICKTRNMNEAIKIAQTGCIPFVDKMSINQQIQLVTNIKMSQNIFIKNPSIMSSKETVKRAKEVINGRCILLINEDNKFVGIVTERDLRFIDDEETVENICTPKDKMVLGGIKITKTQAIEAFKKFKIKYIPILDNNDEILGLITAKDIERTLSFPDTCLNSKGHIIVGAIVDYMVGINNIKNLVNSGIDILWINNYSIINHVDDYVKIIKYVKEEFPNVFIIAGNVSSINGINMLKNNGVDLVSVSELFNIPQQRDIIVSSGIIDKFIFDATMIVIEPDKIQEYKQKLIEYCILNNKKTRLDKN